MTLAGFLVAVWGVGGVIALIARALFALTPIALEAIRSGTLAPLHWVVLLAWVGTNAYAEGYKGFHRKFSPRVVDRALYLGRRPTVLSAVLAPLFCMGLFRASRKTMVTSWVLLVVITNLVIFMRRVAQPWRGIVDAGVVVGLLLGTLSLIWLFVKAIGSARTPVLHDVP